MDRGRLLALDTPQTLMRALRGTSTLELSSAEPADGAVVPALAALPGVERVEDLQVAPDAAAASRPAAGAPEPGRLRLRLYLSGEAAQLVAPAAAVLAEHELTLTDVRLGAPTLEDVFIRLTGRTLR